MFLFKRHPLGSAKNNFKAPVFFFFCFFFPLSRNIFHQSWSKNKHDGARRPGHGPMDSKATRLLGVRGQLPAFFFFFEVEEEPADEKYHCLL